MDRYNDWFPEEPFGGEWRSFNIHGLYSSPQKVLEVACLLLTLRITLWTIDDKKESITLCISPCPETLDIQARYKASPISKKGVGKRLLACISQDEIDSVLMEMLMYYVPFEEVTNFSQIYITIQKSEAGIEIYGTHEDAQIISRTSFCSRLIIHGLKGAIASFLRRKKG